MPGLLSAHKILTYTWTYRLSYGSNMATTDIRFKRMNDEYQSVRKAQDDLFDKVDTFEEALLGLTEMVSENREMLQAIIRHLDVPYKPPAGFVKD